jgi:L-aspartate oxidase
VRGEGAKLYGKNMERFVDELLPRDKVTAAIREQMELDGTSHVWEDMRPIPKNEMLSHFPNIVNYCREHGFDPVNECIPIVPAQHYFMGGIDVDTDSKTSMNRLYAVGETACNGVHGKNRLASNSLLESLVFAKRAAENINKDYIGIMHHADIKINPDDYENYKEKYKKIVLDAIEKEKQSHEQYNNEDECG